MKHKRNRVFVFLILFVVVLFLSGCAGKVKNMGVVPPGEIITSPAAGKSMIVFMRPSTLGFGIQSSVFEVKNEDVRLAGIVAAKKKVAYELDPGEHLFMVIGESADFMYADLEPEKTYYALVTPRMGVWKARFSLKPVHAEELSSPQFEEWLQNCEWVKIIPESETWATSNMESIQSKRKEYYEKWMNKSENDRPKLLPQDGR
jgi:hypothetical protein